MHLIQYCYFCRKFQKVKYKISKQTCAYRMVCGNRFPVSHLIETLVSFVAVRNCMRQQVAGCRSQRHATLLTYYKVASVAAVLTTDFPNRKERGDASSTWIDGWNLCGNVYTKKKLKKRQNFSNLLAGYGPKGTSKLWQNMAAFFCLTCKNSLWLSC